MFMRSNTGFCDPVNFGTLLKAVFARRCKSLANIGFFAFFGSLCKIRARAVKENRIALASAFAHKVPMLSWVLQGKVLEK